MKTDTEKDIKDMLMDDEKILWTARQSRIMPGGSMTTPNAVYATNKRIIFRNPKFLGLKTNYDDVDYRDVSNIRMKKGLFSTQIFLKSRILSDAIMIPAVDKNDAEQINQIIRKGIEGELPNQMGAATPAKSKGSSPIKQLRELKKLKDMHAITREDYQKKKQELLNEI